MVEQQVAFKCVSKLILDWIRSEIFPYRRTTFILVNGQHQCIVYILFTKIFFFHIAYYFSFFCTCYVFLMSFSAMFFEGLFLCAPLTLPFRTALRMLATW